MSLSQPAGIRKGPAEKRWRFSHADKSGWLSSLPLILVILLLFAYPLFNAMRLSLTFEDGRWLGFARYANVLQDEQMLESVKFSLLFTVSSVVLHLLFGLGMALMLTSRNRSPTVLNAFRGILILPWIISLTVVAPMIVLLFHQIGVINYILKDILHLVSQPVDFMGDPGIAPWFIILISGWQGFPLFMILFIGSIQAIAQERYEAAAIDGANRWQGFRHITLPGVTGTALRLIVLDIIWMWKAFEIVFLITAGGPIGKTTTLSLFIYLLGFWDTRLNYAATVAILMALVSMIVTLVLLRIPEPEVAD
jgi:multiple sugar transport system permease protein